MIRSNKTLKAWQVVFAGLIMANVAYFGDNIFGWTITLTFFLIVPGYLLLRLITKEIRSVWERIGISLGLSILLLMLSGLLLNSLHPFGMQRPLNTLNIFIVLDVLTTSLVILNKNLTFSSPSYISYPNKQQAIMFLALLLLPFLAVGGAIRLNNGASNVFTMILFALTPILFLILIWRKNFQALYPYALLMIGLSVLLSTSLRGWGITGHDIQREFYVFQLTDKSGYWNIAAFRDPYNACLSITVLPTIIAKLTAIPGPYVYKVVFQCIYALSLLPVYFFMKRLGSRRLAFLGAFLCISLPTFTSDMPFLNRQEVGFLFFSLLMLVMFLNIKRQPKNILIVSSLVGIILSHYSSAYTTLGILLFSWIIFRILHLTTRNHISEVLLPAISLPVLIIALLATFLWNTQVTDTTGGLRSTLVSTLENSFNPSSTTHFGARLYKNPSQDLAKYAGADASKISYMNQPLLATPYRNSIFTFFGDIGTNVINFFDARLIQILPLLAFIWAIVQIIRRRTKYYFYSTLVIASIILLGTQMLFPTLAVDYGADRLFQQIFILLGLPVVIALMSILKLSRIQLTLTSIFAVTLFAIFSGFLPQLIGNSYPQLSLNNSGTYYDLFYVHSSELMAADWLSTTNTQNRPITMDDYAADRFYEAPNFTGLVIKPPFKSIPGSYLYEDYANVMNGTYAVRAGGEEVYYTLNFNPNNNKDLIYSNSGSRVYR